MTTQEHLTRIRNLFAKVEEMEKKATIGMWCAPLQDPVKGHSTIIGYDGLCVAFESPPDDASFIALNRNIIVPLVRFAKGELDNAQKFVEASVPGVVVPYAQTVIDRILALFHDELLTLCGV